MYATSVISLPVPAEVLVFQTQNLDSKITNYAALEHPPSCGLLYYQYPEGMGRDRGWWEVHVFKVSVNSDAKENLQRRVREIIYGLWNPYIYFFHFLQHHCKVHPEVFNAMSCSKPD